ncbi:hypothetical protein HVA01_31220 [Halovibrio variabilis]|uniref:Uncharacterized protein n=1 Tax=Halovibrio variabilis TaxID=31910 RepID=A0A511USA2_9GAMM|nr:hypothetical protein [Halovibrio variabilis]GEN29476.1 hypothetical protein HVA01_31220 [Halovibrio variabilis]
MQVLVARGNEEREFSERFEAPTGGGGTTPSGASANTGRFALLSRRAAVAGALTLTPRYKNHLLNIFTHP